MNKMKVLITGANGFLGHYLVPELVQRGHRVLATGKGPCRLPQEVNGGFEYAEMDFTDAGHTKNIITGFEPDCIVHAGAVSKPDECELNQADAWQINTGSTLHLLETATALQSFFVYISTDFVFDGEKGMYAEDDRPSPVNYYGSTKWESEKAVQQYKSHWAIVRTVLVYGQPLAGRSNILSIVRDKLVKQEGYNVVDDQLRTPTYVGDLARGIATIIEKKATGTWHLSGKDQLTPYEMACRTADYLGLDRSLLTRVTAETFTQPAKRPPRTGFIIDKAKRELGFAPLSFEEGLSATFGKK
jgi:dTDP-4-dehydrorhamnose reductase